MYSRFLRKCLALLVIHLLILSPLVAVLTPTTQIQAAVRQLSPGSGGTTVGSNAEVIDLSNIVSDGSGGFYIAWSDSRDGDGSHPYSIYVQRFDSDGNALNGNGGTKVANIVELNDSDQLIPDLVASASGDVIATWRDDQDSQSGNEIARMFTQAVDTNGDLLIPSLEPANLIEQNTSTYASSSVSDPTTIEHTVSGTNRFLIVSVLIERGPPQFGFVDDITYDNTSLSTLCGNDNNIVETPDGNELVHEMWYMNNPGTGTADLVVDLNGGVNDMYVEVTTLNNVDTDSPIDDINCYDSSTAGATTDGSAGTMIAESSVADSDYTVEKGLYASLATLSTNGNALTPSFGLTEYWNTTVGDLLAAGGVKPSDEDSVNEDTEYGWRGTRLDPWVMGAVVLNLAGESQQSTPSYTGTPLSRTVDQGDFLYETVSDGAGGQVNARMSGSKIYAQRLDARGIKLWGESGTEVNPNNSNSNAGTQLGFATDGTSYFAGWGDRDGANTLVAQKINSSGVIQWNAAGSPAGVSIDTTGSYDRRYPLDVTPDGAGGMMMLFSRAPISTGTIDLRVQHIDSSGSLQFGTGGLELHSFSSNNSFPFSFGKMIRDDDGNYIAMWTRDDDAVYAQKFDQDGDELWTDGGVQIGSAQSWGEIELISDGQGGAFIALHETGDDEIQIQGIFEDGTLLWSDFYTLSTGTATGQPRLYSTAAGEAVVAWEEDRGSGNNAYFMMISNLYQIRSLSGLTPEDSSGNDIAFGTNNGVKNSAEEVTVIDSGNEYPISKIDVNLTQDRDWSGVGGDVDSTNAKSFVSSLTDADGADSSHTLYVPYDPSHTGVTICPDATTLDSVSLDCSGAVTKTEADGDTSIETVNGKQVWAITGLTGTGGIGVPSGGSELTFADGGTIEMISPKNYTTDHQPKLRFSKAVLGSGSVTSYNVTLDTGMWRSFQVNGIPAQGNGQANYVWRDNDDVKVTFYNEQDDDPSNDEIEVFFKKLSSGPLTEGKHGWGVTVFDNQDAQSTVKQGFYLDRTKAEIDELSLAGDQLVGDEADTVYYLKTNQRTPGFGGRLFDIYRGSERTNENGSIDTFLPVSSGPKTLKLAIEKLSSGDLATETADYQEYWSKQIKVESITDVNEVEKHARFYMVPETALENGGYKVMLTLTDEAGNQTEKIFYLSVGAVFPRLGGLSLVSNALESEITQTEQIPAETDEEKEQLEEEGATVTVSVVDENQNQLGGIGVTLLETEQSAVTNDDGKATFQGVVAGAYTVEVAYDNQTSEQAFTVDEGRKEVAVTVQVTFVKKFYWQGVLSGLVLAGVSGFLILVLKRRLEKYS